MNVGKLYLVNRYFWYLYPKDIAAKEESFGHVQSVAAGFASSAAALTAVWSKKFNCKITFVSPNDIFCLLEQDGKLFKVLSTNGELGWMIYPTNEAWTKGCIEEVNQ
jgi:hypothetical protein